MTYRELEIELMVVQENKQWAEEAFSKLRQDYQRAPKTYRPAWKHSKETWDFIPWILGVVKKYLVVIITSVILLFAEGQSPWEWVSSSARLGVKNCAEGVLSSEHSCFNNSSNITVGIIALVFICVYVKPGGFSTETGLWFQSFRAEVPLIPVTFQLLIIKLFIVFLM